MLFFLDYIVIFKIEKKFPSRRSPHLMYVLATGIHWKRSGVPDAAGTPDETCTFFTRHRSPLFSDTSYIVRMYHT